LLLLLLLVMFMSAWEKSAGIQHNSPATKSGKNENLWTKILQNFPFSTFSHSPQQKGCHDMHLRAPPAAKNCNCSAIKLL